MTLDLAGSAYPRYSSGMVDLIGKVVDPVVRSSAEFGEGPWYGGMPTVRGFLWAATVEGRKVIGFETAPGVLAWAFDAGQIRSARKVMSALNIIAEFTAIDDAGSLFTLSVVAPRGRLKKIFDFAGHRLSDERRASSVGGSQPGGQKQVIMDTANSAGRLLPSTKARVVRAKVDRRRVLAVRLVIEGSSDDGTLFHLRNGSWMISSEQHGLTVPSGVEQSDPIELILADMCHIVATSVRPLCHPSKEDSFSERNLRKYCTPEEIELARIQFWEAFAALGQFAHDGNGIPEDVLKYTKPMHHDLVVQVTHSRLDLPDM